MIRLRLAEPVLREILHISDIHFGPYYLPEVGEGVLELIERRLPHLVVI